MTLDPNAIVTFYFILLGLTGLVLVDSTQWGWPGLRIVSGLVVLTVWSATALAGFTLLAYALFTLPY